MMDKTFSFNGRTVPCSWCAQPTTMLGTRHCDRCHELETRIRRDPSLARRMLRQIMGATFAAKPFKDCWKTQDGRILFPSEMDTHHLINVGHKCYRIASKELSERSLQVAATAASLDLESMASYYAEQAADELIRRATSPEVIKGAAYRAWPVLQLMEDELRRRGVI